MRPPPRPRFEYTAAIRNETIARIASETSTPPNPRTNISKCPSRLEDFGDNYKYGGAQAQRMRGLYAAIIVLTVVSAASTIAVAWEDCPYGLVNDHYPGHCGRYVDTDADGICDHSQATPAERAASTPVVPEPPAGEDPPVEEPLQESPSGNILNQTYHVIPILAIVSALYALTYALSKKGKITLAAHRKMWNFALLGTFLVSGLLGIALAVAINFGWKLPISSLFVHVEFGIAMAGVALFHTAWHWRYYAGKASKKDDCPPPGAGNEDGRKGSR